MRLIESYMDALAAALHVRGRRRRRFLDECREHLTNAAADRGEHDAVRAFGPAATIAAAFDAEAATQRALRATSLTVAGVLLTGASTLALIQGAEAGTTAPALWAIVFFVAAQLAGTAVALASLQGLAQRHETIAPAELSLLCRRNLTALVSAGVTMFAAGAAVPGQASPFALMAGPVCVCVAFVATLRARHLARRLPGARDAATRSPLEDLRRLLHAHLPELTPARLLAAVTVLAAAAAFARDRAEHASAAGAAATAGIEAFAVVACFAFFGRELGLWRRAATSGSATPTHTPA